MKGTDSCKTSYEAIESAIELSKQDPNRTWEELIRSASNLVAPDSMKPLHSETDKAQLADKVQSKR